MFPPKNRYINPHDAVRGLAGFSIIEILIVIAIIGILLSIASPAYENYINKRDFASTTQNLLAIQTAIDRFYIENNRFPESLQEIDLDHLTDAWDKPFYYLNMATYNKKTSDYKSEKPSKESHEHCPRQKNVKYLPRMETQRAKDAYLHLPSPYVSCS